MILIPAIDIKDKKCVRLFKGDFSQQKVYSENPVDMAIKWEKCGAQLIHLVDLDGALEGESINFEVIKEISSTVNCEVQIGGGIRNTKTVESYIKIGASRVIIGTSAFTDEDFLNEACKAFPGKIAVGIDIKDNKVAIKGWNTKINLTLSDAIKKFEDKGIELIVLTSVDRDGTLEGFNRNLVLEYLSSSSIPMIVSGGIKDHTDLKQINSLKNKLIYGTILGKSLYENKIDLKKCITDYQNVS